MAEFIILKKDFGANLKLLREREEISQGMLADQLNVLCQTNYSRNNVSKWEGGAAFPPISLLPALSKLLKVPMVSFFSFEEKETSISGKEEDLSDKIDSLKREYLSNPNGAFDELCKVLDATYMELKSTKKDYDDLRDITENIGSLVNKIKDVAQD